jgi:uncharacterized protein with HEPN domain
LRDVECSTPSLSLNALLLVQAYLASGPSDQLSPALLQDAPATQLDQHGQIFQKKTQLRSDNAKLHSIDSRPWIMRHLKIVHQYFGLDLCDIWDIVSNDLPLLKIKIQELLDNQTKS